ncbi:MAG: SRPBCC domain-containing protein [Anaerolineae bacterium]|nr:SRPBCC domain-containing protein [Anaerolineae bacterium]
MSDDSIVIDIFYPYPVSRVWDALVDSESLAEWLMPNDFVPQVGHRFTFVPSAQQGWSGVIECEVVEVKDQSRISYTWNNEPSHLESLVTFSLEPAQGGTNLRLEHTGFESAGQAGLSIRDMLGKGWNSRVLREKLPALLSSQDKN